MYARMYVCMYVCVYIYVSNRDLYLGPQLTYYHLHLLSWLNLQVLEPIQSQMKQRRKPVSIHIQSLRAFTINDY